MNANFKKFLKDYFSDKQKILSVRYKSSKLLFILMTFIFFLDYFFVWAQFYYNFFIRILPYTYLLYLVSFLFYIFFFFKSKIFIKFKWNIAEIIFLMFLILLFLLFSSIVVVWKNLDFISF